MALVKMYSSGQIAQSGKMHALVVVETDPSMGMFAEAYLFWAEGDQSVALTRFQCPQAMMGINYDGQPLFTEQTLHDFALNWATEELQKIGTAKLGKTPFPSLGLWEVGPRALLLLRAEGKADKAINEMRKVTQSQIGAKLMNSAINTPKVQRD